MKRDSKYVKAVIQAYKMGYRVKDGKLYNVDGNELSPYVNPTGSGYCEFTIRWNKTRHKVRVHHLIAYQKFGNKAFEPGMQIRHLNGDSMDNRYSNIGIGDASANSMDRPPEERFAHAVKAATDRRIYTDYEIETMRRLHAEGWTYKRLMEEFGVKSKGHMSYIINHDYITTK